MTPFRSGVTNLLLLLLLLLPMPLQGSNVLEWEAATAYPGPARHHPITFANETHGFLLTGSTIDQVATSDFYMYDAANDAWTDLSYQTESAFPGTPRGYAYGVVLNVPFHAKAYLGLGAGETGLLNDFWEFDMVTHVWKQLADMPIEGRRHPAMNAVRKTNQGNRVEDTVEQWEIHVGLGDDSGGNLNDWWIYDIATDAWEAAPDLPAAARHHPFHFSLGAYSYTGLGHSSQGIERDWYRMENGTWIAEPNFESFNEDDVLVTTEARVAGTQFSMEFNGDTSSAPSQEDSTTVSLSGSMGFVLSGDGDDHRSMTEGEFHAFDPITGRWHILPPHPGRSRWAPGSFVIRGSPVVYFTSGYDRTSQELFNDVWRIDLTPLFLVSPNNNTETVPVSTPSNMGGMEPTSSTMVLGVSFSLFCWCLVPFF